MKKNLKAVTKKRLKRDPKIEAKIKRFSSMQFSVGHPTNSVELLKKYSR